MWRVGGGWEEVGWEEVGWEEVGWEEVRWEERNGLDDGWDGEL